MEAGPGSAIYLHRHGTALCLFRSVRLRFTGLEGSCSYGVSVAVWPGLVWKKLSTIPNVVGNVVSSGGATAQKSSHSVPVLKQGAHWMKLCFKSNVFLGQHLCYQQERTPTLPECVSGSKCCSLHYLINSIVHQSSHFSTNSKCHLLAHPLLELSSADKDELNSLGSVL